MNLKDLITSYFRKIAKPLEVFRRMLPENKERLLKEYFTTATHYYVSARYAHFGSMIPTAGNLFHHAIEMYLKGHLSLKLNERERKKLRHSLWQIWRRFKRDVGDPTLDKFDSIIKALDKFEDIRYPEKLLRLGANINFGLARLPPGPSTTGGRQPLYELYVQEIDELVAILFQKTGVNPAFYLTMLSEDRNAYLKKDNPMKHVWGL